LTVLYEPLCWGGEHAPFNAALLATVASAYPGQSVEFHGEASHLEAVRQLLPPREAGTIQWVPLAIAPRKLRGRERFRFDHRVSTEVLRATRQNAVRRLVACSTTDTALLSLKLGLLLCPQLRVAVVHHSGLVTLMASRSTRFLLRYGNRHLRHVVLGSGIRAQIEAMDKALAPDVVAMPHPYLFGTETAGPWPDGEPVRFGFLGLASAVKGYDRFCELALYVGRGAHRFELIGRLGPEYAQQSPPGAEWVEHTTQGNGPLPRNCYEDRVRALTYTIFPYDAAEYSLVSSGAILDAFSFLKPCIALRVPVFEDYFRAMGDIGYLCEDPGEMQRVVRALACNSPGARYLRQRQNLERGRRMFHPEQVARQLQQALG
jgi:hypothetical protein